MRYKEHRWYPWKAAPSQEVNHAEKNGGKSTETSSVIVSISWD